MTNGAFDFAHLLDRRHRAHRGAARPAKRALRLGRHRRRDLHHHQAGRRAAQSDGHGGRRLVRHLQSGARLERLAGQLQLRLQRPAFPFDRQAGDAAPPAGARREKRNNDSYNNWTYSTKLGARADRRSRGQSRSRRYTDAKLGFTGEDYCNFIRRRRKRCRARSVNHKLFSRGEVVWSLFDGKFKNYFGVELHQSMELDLRSQRRQLLHSASAWWRRRRPMSASARNSTGAAWRKWLPAKRWFSGWSTRRKRCAPNSTGTVDALFNYTQIDDDAPRPETRPAYVELQSEFAKRFFLVSNIRYDDNESFGPHTTWRVAPAVHRSRHRNQAQGELRHRLQGADADRSSTSAIRRIRPVANPNLRPEESKGYDIGFEQPLLHDRVRFGATYFHNDITNLIVNAVRSGHLHVHLCQCRQRRNARHRSLRRPRRHRSAEIARATTRRP